MIFYRDDAVTLHHGDSLHVMPELPDASMDAVVTDPPYGLEFMGKEWDSFKPADAKIRARVDGRTNGAEKSVVTVPEAYRAGLPFQIWCEQWAAECLRVLKPGGHLLAFGGTRTWHRLAVAIEDAGFELRDSIAWLYSQGFPKSLDVSKAIDKAAGAERTVATGVKPGHENFVGRDGYRSVKGDGALSGDGGFSRPWMSDPDASEKYHQTFAPATPEAAQWSGFGTALKPAFEPCIWARKPFSAVPLSSEANRLHHLLGGLLWLSLSPAKRAELTSQSSRAEQPEAWCVSVLATAVMDTSQGASGSTDTFSSQVLASTSLSIASSWSSTLDALSAQTRTSTTSTRSSTTTGLRILFSLLAPLTSRTTMPACECLTHGPTLSAPNVASGSPDDWWNWLHILSASVPEPAIEGTARAVESALAAIADELSGVPAVDSSALPTATTRADGSSSAFEPIVVARKPFPSTVAANVLAHGTGALNIDGCRIGTGDDRTNGGATGKRVSATEHGYGGGAWPHAAEGTERPTGGRWPANVVLDADQARRLDDQSGYRPGDSPNRKPRHNTAEAHNRTASMGRSNEDWITTGHNDSGGASRFFYTAKADSAERPEHDGIAHPTIKPLSLMRWLVRLVTPPGGIILEPFAGSGTTVEAAILEGFRCIAIEREADYLPLILQRIHRRLDPVAYLTNKGDDLGLFGESA